MSTLYVSFSSFFVSLALTAKRNPLCGHTACSECWDATQPKACWVCPDGVAKDVLPIPTHVFRSTLDLLRALVAHTNAADTQRLAEVEKEEVTVIED